MIDGKVRVYTLVGGPLDGTSVEFAGQVREYYKARDLTSYYVYVRDETKTLTFKYSHVHVWTPKGDKQ